MLKFKAKIYTVRGFAMIGIMKEFDRLGRIVIPKELWERYGFYGEVEIVATENGVLIQNPKYILTERGYDHL